MFACAGTASRLRPPILIRGACLALLMATAIGISNQVRAPGAQPTGQKPPGPNPGPPEFSFRAGGRDVPPLIKGLKRAAAVAVTRDGKVCVAVGDANDRAGAI